MLFLNESQFSHSSYHVLDGNRPGDRSLGVRATVGWERTQSTAYEHDGPSRPARPYEQFIFQWSASGCGELERPKARQRFCAVPAGHAFLVSIPSEHIYRFPMGGEPWDFAYINISGAITEPLWREALRVFGPVAKIDADSPPIEILRNLYRIGGEMRSRANWLIDPTEVAAMVLEFLVSLIRYSAQPRSGGVISESAMASAKDLQVIGEKERKSRSPQAAILRAAAFARTHYAEGIGVEALAESARLSRHHFTRLFHEQLGIPPLEYLTRLRLRRAAQYIMEQTHSMDEIARAIGFADGKYLAKLFKRRTGLTPRRFRERCEGVPDLAYRLI